MTIIGRGSDQLPLELSQIQGSHDLNCIDFRRISSDHFIYELDEFLGKNVLVNAIRPF
jgi:hypothetical protein